MAFEINLHSRLLATLLVSSVALQPSFQQLSHKPSRRTSPPNGTEEGITSMIDVPYRHGNKGSYWLADIYTPGGEKAPNGWPAIVFIHSGGWHLDSKEELIGNFTNTVSTLARRFAAEGYVTLNMNYRLLPDDPFPAQVEDVKNAVRFLRAKATVLNVDPERIGTYGASSGAHMAAMAGLAKGMEGDGPYQSQSSAVQAVAGISMPVDLKHWFDNELCRCELLLPGDGNARLEEARLASPISYVYRELKGRLPPFLLFHAKDDNVVPYNGQSEALAEKICKAGGSVKFLSSDTGGHSGYFIETYIDQIIPHLLDFFETTLKGSVTMPFKERCIKADGPPWL